MGASHRDVCTWQGATGMLTRDDCTGGAQEHLTGARGADETFTGCTGAPCGWRHG